MTKKLERYEAHGIENMILTVRGQKVILDADLARIYGVPTKRLKEQARRNADRFPADRQVPRKPRPLERGQGAQHKMKLPFREAPPFRAGSFT